MPILKNQLFSAICSLQSNAFALDIVIVKKLQQNLGITHLGRLAIITLYAEALSYYKFSHGDKDIEKQNR